MAVLFSTTRGGGYNSLELMPYCKNCHKEISRLDADVCPYCGEKRPIDEDYATKDMTSHIDPVTGHYELYKSKSHKVYAILAMTVGFTGAHDFYLGFKGRGAIFLTFFLLSFLCFFVLPLFGCIKPYVSIIALPTFWIIFDLILGIALLKKDCLKDATGEFLR